MIQASKELKFYNRGNLTLKLFLLCSTSVALLPCARYCCFMYLRPKFVDSTSLSLGAKAFSTVTNEPSELMDISNGFSLLMELCFIAFSIQSCTEQGTT